MTKFIAHRGDPIRFRENTLPAFVAGEQNGADMVELDVQLSRDGKCVILHDDTLNRLWDVDAAVSELTYEQMRRHTADQPFEIPLLEDVIHAVRVPIMIDVKFTNSVDPIVETLHRTESVDRALIVGGNIDAHRRVRQLLPRVQTGLTWEDGEPPSTLLLDELRFNYFNPPYWLVAERGVNWMQLGPEIVGEMHDRGLLVSVWTVDDEPLMWKLVDLGVDVIITNRSQALVEAYQSTQSPTS